MSFYNETKRNTWLEVNLNKLEANFKIIQSQVNLPVLVVVKANAYGHGLVECAKTVIKAGAKMLGVATLGEAQYLRRNDVIADILRITAYGLDEIEVMLAENVQFFVWNKEQALMANELAGKIGKQAIVHLQVDTGMGREGLFADQALEYRKFLNTLPNIEVIGLCSHFYLADSKDISSVTKQLKLFNQALDSLEQNGLRPKLAHIANSPGLLRFKEARFDMVRSGVITYGMPYEEGFDLPEGIMPIAEWKARIVSLRDLPAGHVVSYGGQYITSQNEQIAILPVGYADGLHRFPKNVNQVLIQGRIVPTVGRICMDQCMLSIPKDLNVVLGEEVVIIGEQRDANIGTLDVANRWGTNNYDVVANIRSRVPRIYLS